MTPKTENPDECLARKWLELNGYSDIRRVCDDPPDYLVDRRYAVEVRRLNLEWTIKGSKRELREQTVRHALISDVKKIMKEFGPPIERRGWYVDVEYDPSSRLPKGKNFKNEIRQALEEVNRSHELEPAVEKKLGCGVRLYFLLGSPASDKFVFNHVSRGEGLLRSELLKNIPKCIKDKSDKIKNRVEKYSDWWLVLVDYIGVAPISSSELEYLLEQIPLEGIWSRIIIVSSQNPAWHYELRSPRKKEE